MLSFNAFLNASRPQEALMSNRSGRPRCNNQCQDHFLHIVALCQRTTNATRLRQEMRRAANLNISRQTVRNLHEFGLRSRVAIVCLPLTPSHRQARRAWCRRQQRWTRQQWGRVLCTDESRFTLTNNDARERVWRHPGEQFVDT